MALFAKRFTSLLVFVYHCFDRVVIHGYLGGLSRPELRTLVAAARRAARGAASARHNGKGYTYAKTAAGRKRQA
jgi:hypothetical protein